MVRINLYYYLLLSFFLLSSCGQGKKQKETSQKASADVVAINHAKGFKVTKLADYKIVDVLAPWPNSEETFRYVLVEKGKEVPKDITYDALVRVPVEKIVVTSTTHIPALEALGVENKLVGFPDTKYISSKKTRKNIDSGKVKELGINESINTEILIDLNPDVVVGFSINSQNKAYKVIENSGIPVAYNGDWAEETPLGKAEWVKFFAPFFNKEKEADSIFNLIETEYNNAKKLAQKSKTKPTVLSGDMYKDVWYMPAGQSWAAQFLSDANADYLWKETKGTGSLALNFESVLEKAQKADFWIGMTQFTSYEQLLASNEHNSEFHAFKNKKVYTISLTKGETGGTLYYELGPNRPDIILKDLIYIFHPELLPQHHPFFFKPLE